MARFRNIDSVTLLGTAIAGVQRVSVRGEATEIEYEGDDDAGIQDIGVTKRFFSATVEILSEDKLRDIRNPKWTDKAGSPTETNLNEVLAAEFALEGQPVQDSAEDDTWLTYIGVRSVRGSLDLTLRDVDQAFGAVFPIGRRGEVDFDMQPPLSTAGLPDSGNAVAFNMDNLVLLGVEGDSPHGELGQAMLRLAGHGASGAAPAITCSAIPAAVGATGSLVYTAKSATGGTDKTVTLANCVVVRVRGHIEHGGLLSLTYELQAYSSDGETSPLSVA